MGLAWLSNHGLVGSEIGISRSYCESVVASVLDSREYA